MVGFDSGTGSIVLYPIFIGLCLPDPLHTPEGIVMSTVLMPPQVQLTEEEVRERELAPLWNASLLQVTEEEFPVSIYTPTIAEIYQAAPPSLKTVLDEDPLLQGDPLLQFVYDVLGLAVIVDIGKNTPDEMRMSWSVATTDDWAQDQMKQFSRTEYRELRQGLNIDYHWIFRTDSDYWNYEDQDLIEGHITFDQWDCPECWIFDRRPQPYTPRQ